MIQNKKVGVGPVQSSNSRDRNRNDSSHNRQEVKDNGKYS